MKGVLMKLNLIDMNQSEVQSIILYYILQKKQKKGCKSGKNKKFNNIDLIFSVGVWLSLIDFVSTVTLDKKIFMKQHWLNDWTITFSFF